LGRDENIEEFKRIISNADMLTGKVENVLDNFVLRAVLLEPHNTHIGRSIRDSQIREAAEGLVVGLERRGMEILNPDPATVLEAGDLLLMVGKSEKLKRFNSTPR
jgi:monovalent cation:H+ antiporter-2, CPA2 family